MHSWRNIRSAASFSSARCAGKDILSTAPSPCCPRHKTCAGAMEDRAARNPRSADYSCSNGRLPFFIRRMKAAAAIAFVLFLAAAGQSDAQEIDGAIITEDGTVRGDAMTRYFLIRHRLEPAEVPPEHALLLILPGGPGSADFLPFCANVLTRHGTPNDFIV